MESQQLKEFMRRTYLLERSLFEQKKVIDSLDRKLKSPIPYKREENEVSISEYGWYWDWDTIIALSFWAYVIAVLCAAGVKADNDPNASLMFIFKVIYYSFGVLIPSLIVPLIVIVLYIIAVFIRWISGAKMAKKENKEIMKQNAIIYADNQRIFQIETIQRRNMQLEKQQLQISMRKTSEILQNYYNMGIIHRKYWYNLAAISSFYEYLDIGRCSSLEGYDGAYNIYENELRQDRIIEKLDVVIEKLDQIRSTQYWLYDAICESTKVSKNIIDSMTKTQESLADIAHNVRVNAYNSKITANNTECLKWLQILN